MSLESLDRIKKAEEDARNVVERAKSDAAAMIKKVQSDGETFSLSEKTLTQEKLQKMMNEAKLSAEEEIADMRRLSDVQLEELKTSATSKLADVARAVRERIMEGL